MPDQVFVILGPENFTSYTGRQRERERGNITGGVMINLWTWLYINYQLDAL